jgi:NTP pyrophosphatase (non-canonical NTP hydrolase)
VSEPLNELAEEIRAWGERKGWNDKEVNLSEKLLLIVSEITEAFEHYRNGLGVKDIVWDETGKPDGFGVELADAAIRLLHLCALLGLDLDNLLAIKMAYNETRPYRHGNKIA